MKKIILTVSLVFIIGCAGVQLRKPVTPECDSLTDSWICEQSHKAGIEPENVYGWLFSAAAIAAIQDTDNITVICGFEGDIADWYDRVSPISYDSLIDEMLMRSDLFKDPRQTILVKRIINENVMLYESPELIKEDDDLLLRKGHSKFRRDML